MRKSKRELERELEDLEAEGGVPSMEALWMRSLRRTYTDVESSLSEAEFEALWRERVGRELARGRRER